MSEFLAAALTPEEAIRYALADAGSTDPRPLVPYRLLDGSVIGRLAMEGMAAEELLELRRAGLTTAEIERVAEVLTAPALAQMRTRKVPYPEWLGQLDTSARQSPPRPDRAAAGHGVAARTAAEDHWLERAHPWLTAAGFNLRHPPELLSYLRENGLDFATSTSELFDLEVDDEWLEDIQQRALHVSAHLNREPQWPVSFVSTTTTVVLDARSSRAVAWVGRGSLGGLVTFDIATFEVSMLQSPNSAYMAGLAISWFVDCCILLRSPAAAARVLQLDNDPMPKGSQPGFRYAPKPSFECDFLDVATGVRATPSPHRVAGHPRTLRPDQRPSQAALERVPPRLRGTLASNQTWVQEHDRAGAADGDNLYSHLSKYSCLADSLGTAQRHR